MIHRYFVEGRQAFLRDPLETCPYDKGSEPSKSWHDGWNHEWFEVYEGVDDE